MPDTRVRVKTAKHITKKSMDSFQQAIFFKKTLSEIVMFSLEFLVLHSITLPYLRGHLRYLVLNQWKLRLSLFKTVHSIFNRFRFWHEWLQILSDVTCSHLTSHAGPTTQACVYCTLSIMRLYANKPILLPLSDCMQISPFSFHYLIVCKLAHSPSIIWLYAN